MKNAYLAVTNKEMGYLKASKTFGVSKIKNFSYTVCYFCINIKKMLWEINNCDFCLKYSEYIIKHRG